MRKLKRIVIGLSIIIFLCLSIGLSVMISEFFPKSNGNDSKEDGGNTGRFAFYMVKSGPVFNETNHSDINDLVLDDIPLLTENDLVCYYWSNHTFKVTSEVLGNFPTQFNCSISGERFVVVANGERIYIGLFWTYMSSLMPYHCWINAPFSNPTNNTFTIYGPGWDYEEESNLRDNSTIRKALMESGKLIE